MRLRRLNGRGMEKNMKIKKKLNWFLFTNTLKKFEMKKRRRKGTFVKKTRNNRGGDRDGYKKRLFIFYSVYTCIYVMEQTFCFL